MNITKRSVLAALVLPAALGTSLAACGSTTTSTSSTAKTASSTPAANAAAVDKAFVRQMVPHHEGAVRMAKLALAHGQHAEINTLANNVIRSQTTEIGEMTAIAATLGVTPGHATMGSMGGSSMGADAATLGLSMNEMGMSMDMTALGSAKPFDRAFIDDMLPHHTGAVAMAKAELVRGGNAKLKTLSKAIIAAQTKEIAEMKAWRSDWYGAGA